MDTNQDCVPHCCRDRKREAAMPHGLRKWKGQKNTKASAIKRFIGETPVPFQSPHELDTAVEISAHNGGCFGSEAATVLILTVSNAQTSPNKTQLLPYDDADGYQVLYSIIDAGTSKLKSEPVSIFHQTISEEALRGVRFQCSGSIPAEFQNAAEGFDKKTKTEFLLRQEFFIQKKYKLVALVRKTPVNVGNQSKTASASATFSVSVVGFDDTKSHAIALVRYIVQNGGAIGGSSTFHLLRKTAQGWQEATEIQKCGRIY